MANVCRPQLRVWSVSPVEDDGTEPALALLANLSCDHAVRALTWVTQGALVASDVASSVYVVEEGPDGVWTMSTKLFVPSAVTALCDNGAGGAFAAAANGAIAAVTRQAGGGWSLGPAWQAHDAECSCVCLNSAGTMLASGGHDCLVKLWSTGAGSPTPTLVHTIRDHSRLVPRVASRGCGSCERVCAAVCV